MQYERAVEEALKGRPENGPDGSPSTTLMVVGAGRGPLVRASLAASVKAGKKLRVFAVEKNPNAVITLRNMKETEGWDNVTIISSDMRKWKAPCKADILVSELLGSFADNELSPECLDGAQAFLDPVNGISIPCDSTSFLAPMTSSKLWNAVKDHGGDVANPLKHFETPYVVKLFNHAELAPAQAVFKFDHPNRPPRPAHLSCTSGGATAAAAAAAAAGGAGGAVGAVGAGESKEGGNTAGGAEEETEEDVRERIDNRRYTKLEFECNANAMLHGFAGYFESTLFGDHMISINPATFSTGMFSWFPIYFPLRHPVYVTQGQRIEVHMWRCVSDTKVWYEWCLNAPTVSPIHNPNGRSYWIGL